MRIYKSISGDTWDKIAFKFYKNLGGEKLTHILLAANENLREIIIFNSGVEIKIPEVDIPAVENRPPWKR